MIKFILKWWRIYTNHHILNVLLVLRENYNNRSETFFKAFACFPFLEGLLHSGTNPLILLLHNLHAAPCPGCCILYRIHVHIILLFDASDRYRYGTRFYGYRISYIAIYIRYVDSRSWSGFPYTPQCHLLWNRSAEYDNINWSFAS